MAAAGMVPWSGCWSFSGLRSPAHPSVPESGTKAGWRHCGRRLGGVEAARTTVARSCVSAWGRNAACRACPRWGEVRESGTREAPSALRVAAVIAWAWLMRSARGMDPGAGMDVMGCRRCMGCAACMGSASWSAFLMIASQASWSRWMCASTSAMASKGLSRVTRTQTGRWVQDRRSCGNVLFSC